MWNLPRQGIKPVSPALAGRFFTTEPPGKPLLFLSILKTSLDFPDSSVGKESACNAGDPGSIPGSGRSPGEGIGYPLQYSWAFLVKNLPAMRETCVRSLGWEDPLEKETAVFLPTPELLPGEFHGQRSLAVYSPWGLKESDTTDQLTRLYLPGNLAS